jgi:hypothetical protein
MISSAPLERAVIEEMTLIEVRVVSTCEDAQAIPRHHSNGKPPASTQPNRDSESIIELFELHPSAQDINEDILIEIHGLIILNLIPDRVLVVVV